MYFRRPRTRFSRPRKREKAQRAGLSFSQRLRIALQNIDSQTKTQQKALTEFQRGKPLEIDFQEHIL